MRKITATAATGLLAAGLLGATVAPASAATSLSKWGTTAAPVFQKLSTDLAAVGKATGSGNATTLAAACTTLGKDTVKAKKKLLPAPNKKIGTPLKAALKYYGLTASTCVSGAKAQDAAKIQKAGQYLNAANSYAAKTRTAIAASS